MGPEWIGLKGGKGVNSVAAAACEPLAVVICLRIGELKKISQHLKTWPINLGAGQEAA